MGGTTKFVLILIGVALFVAMPFFLFGEQIEPLFAGEGALQKLRSFGGFAWLAAIGLLISDVALPVPTTAVMAALGMIYGPVMGGFIAAVGSVVSGLMGYCACRYLGRPVAVRLNGQAGLIRGEALFGKSGGWVVALSRWLPIVSEVVACAAGLSRMPFYPFLGALVCGSVPLGFAYSILGYLGEDQPVLTLIVVALLPFGLWFFARPWLSPKPQRR